MPGHISPIFPSAGIALAAVLILGRSALWGVLLGSFLANNISYVFGPPSHLNPPDKGVGIEPDRAAAKAGLGLLNIRERVRLVRGKADIRTSPGQGCQRHRSSARVRPSVVAEPQNGFLPLMRARFTLALLFNIGSVLTCR